MLFAEIVGAIIGGIILLLLIRFTFIFFWKLSGEMAHILADKITNKMRREAGEEDVKA